jgi:protein transport protein SEC61 subunit gamma-like protein
MDGENPSLMQKVKRFAIECLRVLRVTKKPSRMEFKTVVKVSGLGILVIGFIGFMIAMIRQLLFA